MATIEATGRADPGEVYRSRLDARRSERGRLGRHEGTVANLRVGLFAAAAALGWLAAGGRVAWGWVVVPVVGFAGLVIVHARLKRRIHQTERAAAYYERGLDRVEDRWPGRGEDGARFADEAHPFAADLDLFGRGSLFQRINTARTLAAEATLAAWLKAPQAPVETIRGRQEAVADLAGRLDLREELDGLGDDVRDGLHADALVAWAEGPATLGDESLRGAAVILATLAAPAFAGWMYGQAVALGIVPPIVVGEWTFAGFGPSPFFVIALAEIAFWLALQKRIERVLGPVDSRAADLDRLAGLLGRVEREDFAASMLIRIRDGLSRRRRAALAPDRAAGPARPAGRLAA